LPWSEHHPHCECCNCGCSVHCSGSFPPADTIWGQDWGLSHAALLCSHWSKWPHCKGGRDGADGFRVQRGASGAALWGAGGRRPRPWPALAQGGAGRRRGTPAAAGQQRKRGRAHIGGGHGGRQELARPGAALAARGHLWLRHRDLRGPGPQGHPAGPLP
ncbi:unnamed protein product, partial [Heterosigma akashiwo]